MSVEIIQQRLLSYNSQTIIEQTNALKEIAQEIALMALARSGFFRVAAFQGGTSLRILYGLNRFSEDLDFILEKPDVKFDWLPYIINMEEEFNSYGLTLEVTNKSKLDKNVKIAFLKTDSQGGLLIVKNSRNSKQSLKIKLEIDTNPPIGSNFEFKYLDFPLPFNIRVQDLPSLFAGKCHALLCRQYTKGRDWYDFSWYIARKTPINYDFLAHAIAQTGPWKNQKIKVNKQWFIKQMRHKISGMDWETAKQDVAKFLKPKEMQTLDLWSNKFFMSRLEKLSDS